MIGQAHTSHASQSRDDTSHDLAIAGVGLSYQIPFVTSGVPGVQHLGLNIPALSVVGGSK